MHDVNTASAPMNIRSLFTKTCDVHSHNILTSSNFYINASKLEVQRNAFSRIGVSVRDTMYSQRATKKVFQSKYAEQRKCLS